MQQPNPDLAPATNDPSVRARLGTAALQLFTTRGYAATSVREIVEAAGVTKPVLYYHFDSKEGLYLHLMESGFTDFAAMVESSAVLEGTARERLHQLFQHTYRLFLEHTGEVRLMHAMYYGPPQGAPAFDFDKYHALFEDAVRRIVVDGVAAGEFRPGDPDAMALVLAGVVNIVIELHLCHPERAVDAAVLARLLDLVLDGIAQPSAERP